MERIMLICSAGMSTSMLVNKMKESATAKGMEVDIFAVGTNVAQTHFDDASKPVDVVLLGPQVRFMKSKFEKALEGKNIPVEVIDMKDYGTMNGENVLNRAIELAK